MRAVGHAAAAFGDIGLRLEGGTALAAYYLRHRESEDLDFFTVRELAIPEFVEFLVPHLTAAGLVATATRAPRRPRDLRSGDDL